MTRRYVFTYAVTVSQVRRRHMRSRLYKNNPREITSIRLVQARVVISLYGTRALNLPALHGPCPFTWKRSTLQNPEDYLKITLTYSKQIFNINQAGVNQEECRWGIAGGI